MSGHTPGPWAFDRWDNVIGPDGRQIAAYGLSLANTPAARANAHLIAAAPELLAALESILYYIEEGGNGFEFTCERVARAAIAKATA